MGGACRALQLSPPDTIRIETWPLYADPCEDSRLLSYLDGRGTTDAPPRSIAACLLGTLGAAARHHYAFPGHRDDWQSLLDSQSIADAACREHAWYHLCAPRELLLHHQADRYWRM